MGLVSIQNSHFVRVIRRFSLSACALSYKRKNWFGTLSRVNPETYFGERFHLETSLTGNVVALRLMLMAEITENVLC